MMLQGLISFLNQVQDVGAVVVPINNTTDDLTDDELMLLRAETAVERLRKVVAPWRLEDGFMVARNLVGEEVGSVNVNTDHLGPSYWMEWVERGLIEQGYTLLQPVGDW